MSNYHGTSLHDRECKALVDLEKKLGKPIPFFPDAMSLDFGFVKHSEHVTKLGLNKQELTALPRSIGNFVSLKYLYLDQNKLSSLPKSFCRLTMLSELSLLLNKLKTLPESFGDLVALRRLNLDANELTCLPESLGNLS